MRTRNIITALVLVGGMMLQSCDDFLDVRPKSEKLESDLFANAQGYESAIYGVYGSMTSTRLYGREMTWGLTDLMAQDFDQNNTASRALERYQYTTNSDLQTRFSNLWSQAYTCIGYANNVLANLEGKSEADLPLYNLYKGEMLGVRAMIHFDLLRFFSSTDESARGIPYTTTYSQTIHEFKKVGEVYDLILADLHEAETLLQSEAADIKYPRDNSLYYKFQNYRESHLNYYGVLALTARVYWMRGDMANAAKYARMVIASGKFPLADVSEIQDLFAGKLSSKETVFGLYSTSYIETATTYLYNYDTYSSYNPYTDESGKKHLLPYTAVYQQDVDATTQDYRLTHFKTGAGYARYLKNVDYHSIENSTSTAWDERISGINLIHVSEMYLIAAEALLDTDYETALAYYNTETSSRGLTPLRGETRLTHDMIYNEYHKEMFGDGQVWFNMKRLKKDIRSNLDSRVIPASDDVYVVPVPQTEYDYRN